MAQDPADPQDNNYSIQQGGKKKVKSDEKDKFELTTALTVEQGEVEFLAKGPLVTDPITVTDPVIRPNGCGNRCRVRVWTKTNSAGTITIVSDQDLTAAGATSNEVNYSRTLSQGSVIRFEGNLDVTLTSMSGDATVRRQRTRKQPE